MYLSSYTSPTLYFLSAFVELSVALFPSSDVNVVFDPVSVAVQPVNVIAN